MTRRLSATCYVQEPADSIEQAKQGQPREEQVLTRMRLPECPELETVLGSGSASKVWGRRAEGFGLSWASPKTAKQAMRKRKIFFLTFSGAFRRTGGLGRAEALDDGNLQHPGQLLHRGTGSWEETPSLKLSVPEKRSDSKSS